MPINFKGRQFTKSAEIHYTCILAVKEAASEQSLFMETFNMGFI